MIKKLPFHPFIFALYPLLTLLTHPADPLRLPVQIRNAGLVVIGGLVLYAVLRLILRDLARSALLASWGLLLYAAYDPVYELIRDQALGGFVYGRHRYLAPLWVGLLILGVYAIARKVTRTRQINGLLNTAGLVMLAAGLLAAAFTGSWYLPVRAAGLIGPPRLEVTYIDVGYLGPDRPGEVGDSILLRSSEGKTALIDGGYPNQLAVNYLKEHNINHLDIVIMTHPDEDHSGGLIDVIRTIPVDLVISNGQPLDSPVYAELQEAISTAGVPQRIVQAGDTIPFGSLTFEVLNPIVLNPNNVNHGSVVLRLVSGRVAFLFTGDFDALGESYLIEAGRTIRADILKLGHHGADSATSAAFVKKVNPSVAIYSVGAGNDMGLPHAATLNTLEAAGVEVYGTDINGTIIVKTDGKTYQVLPEYGEPH